MKVAESRLIGLLVIVIVVSIPAAIIDAKSAYLSRVIEEAKWTGVGKAHELTERARKDHEELHRRALQQMRDDAEKQWSRDIAARDEEFYQCEDAGGIPALGFGLSVVCVKASCIAK